jgi:hypothetical protein
MNMINICMVHVSMVAAYTDTRDSNTNIALQVTSLCVLPRDQTATSYWSKLALTCVCVCVCVYTYVRVCVSVGRIWFILRIILILLTKGLTIYLNNMQKIIRHTKDTKHVQGDQLKSGPYFNTSNLFTKIYNMLYYITDLYLHQVLEMMSIHFNALIDTFHHVYRNFS